MSSSLLARDDRRCPMLSNAWRACGLSLKNLSACSVKLPLRTKSVGTKVSEAEFAMLEERARLTGLTLSQWVRDVLLAGPAKPGAELAGEVVPAELLAFLRSHKAGKPPEADPVRWVRHKPGAGLTVGSLLRPSPLLCSMPPCPIWWSGVAYRRRRASLAVDRCAGCNRIRAAEGLAERRRAVLAGDVLREVGEIAVPTLYIRAKRDRLASASCAKEFEQINPQIVMAALNGPHLLLQRYPRLAAETVLEFVRLRCAS